MKLRQLEVVIAALGLSAPALAQTSAGSGATTGANIGATGVNETAGQSKAGVKAQGSGSAELNANRPGSDTRATGTDRADQKKKGASKSGTGSTSSTDTSGSTSAGGSIGASGSNETAGTSRSGVKAQGSGSGGADMKR